MSTYTPTERIVRRLKGNGLVPQDQSIRIVFHQETFPVKWEALNAVTGERYKVGGTMGTEMMSRRHWEIVREDDGWVYLKPGEPLPRDEVGGAGIGIHGSGFSMRRNKEQWGRKR